MARLIRPFGSPWCPGHKSRGERVAFDNLFRFPCNVYIGNANDGYAEQLGDALIQQLRTKLYHPNWVVDRGPLLRAIFRTFFRR